MSASESPPPSHAATVQVAQAVPAFTGQRLDRADRLRKDEAWIAARLADPASRAVIVSRDAVLIDRDSDGGRVARVALPSFDEPLLLGIEDGAAVFVADVDRWDGGGALSPLREAGAVLPESDSGLAAYAMALVNWHRRHRFCANCGAPTAVREGGYMRGCPSCGASHFPRLDPVAIMLVEHDGRLLLGRRHSWPERQYSALAGFVAPGETAEEAVVREVLEESGIVAHSPRFVASQPWPFPASLMLGFHARSDGGDPYPRDAELEDVRWFTTAEVRAAAAGDPDGPLRLPPPVAVARFLIERWLKNLPG